MAVESGLSEKSIRNYEKGGLPPDRVQFDKMERFAAVLRIKPSGLTRMLAGECPTAADVYPLDGEDSSPASKGESMLMTGSARAFLESRGHTFDQHANLDSVPRTATPVPEWESEIAAGTWIDCVMHQLDVETQGAIIERGMFIIRVRGESMMPLYQPGVRVMFRMLRLDDEGPVIGRDYCWVSSDGQCTLKRLKAIDDDGYTLAPINPEFDDLYLPRQQLARLAVVETLVKAPWE